MATIQKTEDDTYRVQIRRKGIEISHTFDDIEEAEDWAYYKEKMIDLIAAYDPPLSEMITLEDAIEIKIKELTDSKNDKREICYYEKMKGDFEFLIKRELKNISYSDLLAHYEKLLNIPVRKGGDTKNKDSGMKKLPAEATIFRKFQYLSLVYKLQIQMGVEIDNHALKICQYMRQRMKQAV